MTLRPQPKSQRFISCLRHPSEPVTGFCALCLRERLSGLDPDGCRITPSPSSSLPELRRCKSYCGNRREVVAGKFEPQRKSCDVRARNTLWSLFSVDDGRNGLTVETEVETRNLGLSEIVGTVLEGREEEDDGEEEIRVCEEGVNVVDERVEEVEEEVELKTMKEHIDLEWRSRRHSSRDFKDIAGSFWVAASVLSKKLKKWRREDRVKHCSVGGGGDGGGGDGGGGLVEMEAPKVNGRHLRETQSEVGDYGFGRRSCDTDPRFSVDGGRMSLDGPRYSFDEPRASWDGYMIGTGRALPRLAPLVSVVEDVGVVVARGSEERMTSMMNEKDNSPGGSAQTRDYYTDSSNRRRRSFDQLSAYRKGGLLEFDEMKSISNAKVSPTTVELFHGAKVLITERDLKSKSLKDDSLGKTSVSKDAVYVPDGGNGKGLKKYGRWRKAWSIWGLLHKRGETKYEDVGDDSHTESCVKMGKGVNRGAKGEYVDRIGCSSSSVSSTSSCKLAGAVGSMRTNAEINGHGNKRREHLVLERNRSARYSPNNLDNGLLRFYLTPVRSTRSRCGKSRLKNSQSIARSFLRLY